MMTRIWAGLQSAPSSGCVIARGTDNLLRHSNTMLLQAFEDRPDQIVRCRRGGVMRR